MSVGSLATRTTEGRPSVRVGRGLAPVSERGELKSRTRVAGLGGGLLVTSAARPPTSGGRTVSPSAVGRDGVSGAVAGPGGVGSCAAGARGERAGCPGVSVGVGAATGIGVLIAGAGGVPLGCSGSRRAGRVECNTGTGVDTWGMTGAAGREGAATAVAVPPPPRLIICSTASRWSESRLLSWFLTSIPAWRQRSIKSFVSTFSSRAKA